MKKRNIDYPSAAEANEASRVSEMVRVFEKIHCAINLGEYSIEVSAREISPFIQKELEFRKYKISDVLDSGFMRIYWSHQTINGETE